ncbi:MAG: ketoacyl-ACP synthase III [Bdellovibrionota bacterium]|nr:MAG: ketoacyl-ACP synthase III [Bdellovibrionota bacterium]
MTESSYIAAHSFAFSVPPRRVSNDDLSTLMDTSDEWIRQRTGIAQRYWVDPPTTTSDLGVASARQSCTGQPDALIAATLSPDYCFPGIGVLIQHKLGLPPIPAFDVRNQCCGFLYALQMAQAFIAASMYQRILVVGAEVHSTGLDVSTRGRDIAVLFGDGAGSCIVERGNSSQAEHFEVIGFELHGDGKYASELWCEHPGSAHFPVRITRELVESGKIFPAMNGKKVFEHAVRGMTEVSRSLLTSHGLSPSDVRLVVPHQANLRINQLVGSELGLPADRVFNTIQEFGNTTAATIPIGLTKALQARLLQQGDLVLLCAFGSGFTWGAGLLRYHSALPER